MVVKPLALRRQIAKIFKSTTLNVLNYSVKKSLGLLAPHLGAFCLLIEITMRELIRTFAKTIRVPFDWVVQYYRGIIDITGDFGLFLVHVLIGVSIIAVVGIDYVFIDYYAELSQSKYFHEMTAAIIFFNLIELLKIIALFRAADKN